MFTQEKPRTGRLGCVRGQVGSCSPHLVVFKAWGRPGTARPPRDAIRVGVTPGGEHCLLP